MRASPAEDTRSDPRDVRESDTTDGLGAIDWSKHEVQRPLEGARASGGRAVVSGSSRPFRHSTRVRAMYARDLDDTASSPAVRPPDGLSAAQLPPPPPVDHPRVLAWVLAALLVFSFVGLGGKLGLATLEARALAPVGLLTAGSVEPWRLVHGTFVHSNPFMLAISALLVLVCGGEVERRSGSGLLAFLVVALGAALNAARVVVEPSAGLHHLAGAWPVGLALGGAAVAMATLSPRPGRTPWGLASALAAILAVAVGTLLLLARHAEALGAGLQAVTFLSLGGGLVVGLIVARRSRRPVHPATAEVMGCLLWGTVVTALLASEGQRRASTRSSTPRGPDVVRWESAPGLDVPPSELPAMRRLELADLGLVLDVPAEWKVETPSKQVTCPACQQTVSLTPGLPDSGTTVPCPRCEKPIEAPSRTHVELVEPALFGLRRMRVFSRVRGPYDAPDLQARHFLADVGKGGFLDGTDLLEERPIDGQLGLGHAIVMRGAASGHAILYRTWFFVGERRSIQVDAMVDDEPDAVRGTAHVHEAVARSVRELPR